eukprot:3411031-Amphidinium_carterae.1
MVQQSIQSYSRRHGPNSKWYVKCFGQYELVDTWEVGRPEVYPPEKIRTKMLNNRTIPLF